MDLENNTTSAESTDPVVDTPSVKKPRRRVVRSAGTPAPVAAPEPAPQPRVGTADEAQATETAADEAPASTPAATKTRSRKATRAVAAPDAAADAAAPVASDATGEQAEGEQAPAPKKKATRTRTRKTTPASAEESGAEAPVGEPSAEEAPRRATSTRRRATKAADLDVIADLESAAPAAAKKTSGQAKKSSRGSRSTAPEATDAMATADAGRPTIDVLSEFGLRDGAENGSEPAQEPAAPRKRARSGQRSQKAAEAEAPSEPAAPERPARGRKKAEQSTEPTATAAQATQAPAADEADSATGGRLATTALLFQAPELRPKRRRASAPAGPPEAVVPTFADAQQVSRNVAAEDAAAEEVDESVLEEGLDESAVIEDAIEESEDEDQDEQQEAAEETSGGQRRRRRRGGRGRRSRGGSSGDAEGEDTDDTSGADEAADETAPHESPDGEGDDGDEEGSSSSRRRRRRRRGGRGGESEGSTGSSSGRSRSRGTGADEVTALKGSTRLEAKRQRRREGRDAGRRRAIVTEAEFLARRESVDRTMVVREKNGRTQIAVLEDSVLVEHYVSQQEQASMAGNVYLGRVQNVLPSMEAAFIDVGKGRNAVLYAGEVNWDAAGLEGQPRRIEQALKSGDSVLVQVTKDPIGHKGARLTSQVTLAGRYLVYVPGGGMTGISRKLPDTERSRLKKLLRELVPDDAGVIVRTAAEGASEEELRADITRLQEQWAKIEKKAKTASAPALLQGEPDLAIRVVRDIFNDDFKSLVVSGEQAWDEISGYIGQLAPDLAERVTRWTSEKDVFAEHRVDEQLAKGMDRKVWLPSGGSLVIDRTEAMTVVDVNTGKFTGSGGTLEETVTRNNLEAAEEIVRQLRLRDIGGIIVIDFIDMVLESNRDLVLRRLVECLGRDRTKHQVAEVTSLGLVQMTRKRVGQGLVEAFSETCEHCNGRGFIVHTEPNEKSSGSGSGGSGSGDGESKRSRRKRGGAKESAPEPIAVPVLPESEARAAVKATLATIAAAAAQAHESERHTEQGSAPEVSPAEVAAVEEAVEAGLPVIVVEDAVSVDEAGAVIEEVSVEDRFPGGDDTDNAPADPVVEAEPDAAPAAPTD